MPSLFQRRRCAELCQAFPNNCTGFEHPYDDSYCWLWRNNACSGARNGGFHGDDSYETFYLPATAEAVKGNQFLPGQGSRVKTLLLTCASPTGSVARE